MHKCAYCLCRVCSKVRCPRGKYHCLPCYHGTVLDCPFFIHKKMTRIYRIKKRSPAVTVDDLRKLKDTIDIILSGDKPIEAPKMLQEALSEEEQRHKAALRDILQKSKKLK